MQGILGNKADVVIQLLLRPPKQDPVVAFLWRE